MHNYHYCLIILIILSIILAKSDNDLTSSSQIRIVLAPGQCLAILLPDGYSHVCHEYTNIVSLDDLNRYDYITAVLYERTTGYLRDILQYSSIGSNPTGNNSELILDDDSLGTLFPKSNEVMTDSAIDFHFYFVPSTAATVDIAKNYTKQQSEWKHICIVLFDKHTRSFVDSRCSESENQQIIKLTNISNGEYEAHYFIALIPAFLQNFSKFVEFNEAFKLRMVSLYFNKNGPQPKRITPFSVRIQHGSTASSHQQCTNDECSEPILKLSSPHIYLSTDVLRILSSHETNTSSVHMLLLSCRSQQRYAEAVVLLKSMFYHRDISAYHSRVLVLHLVLDRSGKYFFHELYMRYELYRLVRVIFAFHDFKQVCEAPLRQFLSATSMDQSYHHSGTAGYCRLFLDQYFAKLRNASAASSNSSINFEFTVHLHDQDTGVSAPQPSLDDSLRLLAAKFSLEVSRLITMETDQLIMADIEQLWEQFEVFDASVSGDSDRGEEWLVAAAENYQPWAQSRAKAFRTEKPHFHPDRDHDRTSSKMERRDYHGYGIIGGVMLLNLERMTFAEWPHEIVRLTLLYQQQQQQQQQSSNITHDVDDGQWDGGHRLNMTSSEHTPRRRSGRWEAKQNDQDVFNAVMTLKPHWFRVLPCAWNVQFHARLNSVAKCIHTLFTTINTSGNDDSSVLSSFVTSTSTIHLQQPDEIRQQLWQTNRTFSDIPLNCNPNRYSDYSSGVSDESFVCEDKPKVLHFMAGAYNGYYHFLRYFAYSWEFYTSLSWHLLFS